MRTDAKGAAGEFRKLMQLNRTTPSARLRHRIRRKPLCERRPDPLQHARLYDQQRQDSIRRLLVERRRRLLQ